MPPSAPGVNPIERVRRVSRALIRFSRAVPAVLGYMLLAATAQAGEIEPRAYTNTPVGVNFLLVGYAYSDGGLATEASAPIQDAELKMDTGILAYARSLDVWGNSGKIDIILPYSWLEGSAMVSGAPRERKVSGLHDPRFRFSVNFYGSPAMSAEEFAGYQQDLLIGASIQVSAPLGQYDEDRLINLGTNRWFVKPEIGISKAWGNLSLELSAGVFFFSVNDDYFGGQKLEQDPLYSGQLHITYNFGRGVWAALSGTYDHGGRTTVDGVKNDNVASNTRLGATLALPVDRRNSVKLYASDGMATRTGSDYTLYGVVWQHRWGAGL